MHDFDVDRAKRHAEREAEFGEKPFKFGGETFYVRPNVSYTTIKRVAALNENSSGQETFDAIEESVISMIDPRENAIKRFKKVARSLKDPITFEDLAQLQGWLIAEQTGRPPTQDESSSSTPSATGESSTETSYTELGED